MKKKITFLFFPLFIFSFLVLLAFPGETADQPQTSEAKHLFAAAFPAVPIVEPAILAKDTNVLLRVDTENINAENYDETVEISDDRSDASAGSRKPSEHVAVVDKNMKIYWSAAPLDPESGVTVDVLGIFRKPEGGAEILENVFRDPNKDGIVMGKIKNKDVEGLEYYNILIRVNGDTPETYLIDPKLKMSTN